MATAPNTEEYEELQKASDNYKPQLSGPLVSSLQPTRLLAEEYAKGDPVYKAKTSAIVDTHHAFRTCRGDGNCGWRAMAFGYFESLISLESPKKLVEETIRMRNLNKLLVDMGFDSIYEEFVECTIELLENLASKWFEQDNATALLDAFNDESTSSYINFHFRLLASAAMRSNPAEFEDFLPVSVHEYCKSEIEIPQRELDHPGVRALVDIVYQGAGLGLEIIYLDRSAGKEANIQVHRKSDINDQTEPSRPYPTVTLLYRPGHYDIIYQIS